MGMMLVLNQQRRSAFFTSRFDLLVELWNACGAVVPRERILQRVWGYPSTVLTRTIDTHVAELRRKIERDPSQPEHILTVRSIGYRLVR
jgi:DNA-binding response OmpR family regulator